MARKDRKRAAGDPETAALRDFERNRIREEERLFARVRDAISDRLSATGIRRKDVASALGVTDGRVTQMLSGDNLTLRTIAGIAMALGTRFVPYFEPLEGSLAEDAARSPRPFPVTPDDQDAEDESAYGSLLGPLNETPASWRDPGDIGHTSFSLPAAIVFKTGEEVLELRTEGALAAPPDDVATLKERDPILVTMAAV
jgi:transcriptional regulator with XRE-family HTH domain